MNVHDYQAWDATPTIYRVELLLYSPDDNVYKWHCIAVFLNSYTATKFAESYETMFSIRVRDAYDNHIWYERIKPLPPETT